jgi:hypothetical protein
MSLMKPRRTWMIADYLPPEMGGPSGMPVGHREGVGRSVNTDAWYAWIADDNYTVTYGPFATEAEALEALANPETWA